MIEAGTKVLHESGMLPFGAEGMSSEYVVVKEIFLEILAQAKRQKIDLSLAQSD
jgi:hypothetical protein